MVEFLNIRGILVSEEVKTYKQNVEMSKKSTSLSPKELVREKRLRRSNDEFEDQCCCPPRSMMMPTFVTENKFNEIAERFNKKEVPPAVSIKYF